MTLSEQWIINSQSVEVDIGVKQPVSKLREQLMQLCDHFEGGHYDKFEMTFAALNEAHRRVVVGGMHAYCHPDEGILTEHTIVDAVIHESESLNTCDVYDAFVEDIELHLAVEDGQQNTYTSTCVGQHSEGDTTCFKYRKDNDV